eukprot:scaffold48856_cov25-Phaeocystis_antarctica.AAC.1
MPPPTTVFSRFSVPASSDAPGAALGAVAELRSDCVPESGPASSGSELSRPPTAPSGGPSTVSDAGPPDSSIDPPSPLSLDSPIAISLPTSAWARVRAAMAVFARRGG